MTTTNKIFIITGTLILIAFLGIALGYRTAPVQGASVPSAPAMSVASTSASVTVTSSTRLLATTTNNTNVNFNYQRAYTTICNPSSTVVYVLLDGDKPASINKATIAIAAAAGYNACFELTDDRMKYNGSITASSTNQTSTNVLVTQYVY